MIKQRSVGPTTGYGLTEYILLRRHADGESERNQRQRLAESLELETEEKAETAGDLVVNAPVNVLVRQPHPTPYVLYHIHMRGGRPGDISISEKKQGCGHT
jgi:hypothetical protein